jgi:hypothetical protein
MVTRTSASRRDSEGWVVSLETRPLWRSWILINTGRAMAALDALERARVQDPLEYWTNIFLAQALTYLRRIPEAEAAVAANLRAWTGDVASVWARVWLLTTQARDAEAADVLEAWMAAPATPPAAAKIARTDRKRQAVAALRAAASGAASKRQSLAEALASGARGGGYDAYDALLLICRLGQLDVPAEVARSMYLRRGAYVVNPASADRQLRGVFQPHFLFHPAVDPLRRSGRLREVFAGIGLTDLWRRWGGPDPQLGVAA